MNSRVSSGQPAIKLRKRYNTTVKFDHFGYEIVSSDKDQKQDNDNIDFRAAAQFRVGNDWPIICSLANGKLVEIHCPFCDGDNADFEFDALKFSIYPAYINGPERLYAHTRHAHPQQLRELISWDAISEATGIDQPDYGLS